MDIRQMMDEIGRIEKEKAQLELRQTQLTEKKDSLAKRLALLGVSPQDLDAEVNRLRSDISDKLEAIRSGPTKTQAVKSRAVSADDDIMSILEDK